MKTNIFKRTFILLLIISAIFGVFLNYRYLMPADSSKQCKLDLTQECVVNHNDQKVSVQFIQEIQLEEEIPLKVSLPSNTEITQMWVQGVNMFMGKSPVFVDSVYSQNNAVIYQGHIFLGACSEPKMKWQLVIKTKTHHGPELSWFFNFNTDRNKKS